MPRRESSLPKGLSFFSEEFQRRFKEYFGSEYYDFWAIQIGKAPKICPQCQSEKIKILYLSKPNNREGIQVWSKWYLWCESCLTGIYCPPGSYRIPITDPHILYGDAEALKKALPEGLRLIWPKPPTRRKADEV